VRGVIGHGNDIAMFWDGPMVHCGIDAVSSALPPREVATSFSAEARDWQSEQHM